MKPQSKSETVNIRASAVQKALLAKAAQLENMNVSQFVLSKSLRAAEEVVTEHRTISVSLEEYDWLLSKLEEPPRDLPKLRELFSKPSVFEA